MHQPLDGAESHPGHSMGGDGSDDAPNMSRAATGAGGTPSSNSASASGAVAEATGVDGLIDEFEAELRREGDGDISIWTLLSKRPFTVILALALFSVVVLLCRDSADLLSTLPSRLERSVQISVDSVELIRLTPESMHVKLDYQLSMDYTEIGSHWVGAGIIALMGSLKAVEITAIGPIDVYVESGKSYEHILSVRLAAPIDFVLSGSTATHYTSVVDVASIGRSIAVQALVNKLTSGASMNIRAAGVVSISKWGLGADREFVVDKAVESSPNSYMGELWKLDLVSDNDEEVKLQICASVGNESESTILFHGTIPSIQWAFKLYDCVMKAVEVGRGASGTFTVHKDQDALNLSVDATAPFLPAQLNKPCPGTAKSPLDTWITGYLNNDLNTVVIEALTDDASSTLLHQFLSGVQVPIAVKGKPESEKLVDSVTLREVQFEEPMYPPGSGVGFTGTLIVEAHLPTAFSIAANVTVGVAQLRGDIDLYSEEILFGSIYLENWVPCVTSRAGSQFEILVRMKEAPFKIKDSRQFIRVTQQLMVAGEVPIYYDAILDIDLITPVGGVVVTDLDLEGSTVLRS